MSGLLAQTARHALVTALAACRAQAALQLTFSVSGSQLAAVEGAQHIHENSSSLVNLHKVSCQCMIS